MKFSSTLELAWHEIRSSGRSRSLLVALLLGCMLVVASTVLGATMSARVGSGAAVAYEKSDLVVRSQQGSALDADSAMAGGSSMSTEDAAAMGEIAGVEASAGIVRARAALWGADSVHSAVLESMPPEDFVWQKISEGHAPTSGAEIALSRESMRAADIRVGDTVTLGTEAAGQANFTVTGAIDTRGALGYQSVDYGIVTEPVAQAFAGIDGVNEIQLRLSPDANVDDVMAEINRTLPVGWPQPSEEIVSSTESVYGTGLGVLTSMISGFAVIAALIALVVVATVVWASLPSRRRQLSLMRLVGATRGQLMAVVALETGLIALAAGILAVPLGIALAYVAVPLTGRIPGVPALGWDAVVLPIPWLIVIPIGALIGGILAAAVPVRAVARVSPAGALREAAAPAPQRRLRSALIIAALLAGLVGLFVSASVLGLVWTAAFGALFSLAAIAATPMAARALAGRAERLTRGRSPVAEIAAGEIRAFPGRAAATGLGALLAAVVIAVCWVTLSSVSATAEARSTADPAAEIVVGSYAGAAPLSDDVARSLAETPGVGASLDIDSARLTLEGPAHPDNITGDSDTRMVAGVAALDPAALAKVTDGRFPLAELATDVVYLPESEIPPFADDGEVKVTGPEGEKTLRAEYVADLPFQALVAPEVMGELSSDVTPVAEWLSVAEDADRGEVLADVRATATIAGELPVSGTAVSDARLDQVVGVAKGLATGMLAVAVLIAMIGAAVTLATTLRERATEMSMLRLLGMDSRQLRLSVAGQTWTIGVISVVIGLALGVVLGCAAGIAVAGELGISTHIRVPWIPLLALGTATVVGLRLAATSPIDTVSFVPPAQALRDANLGGK